MAFPRLSKLKSYTVHSRAFSYKKNRKNKIHYGSLCTTAPYALRLVIHYGESLIQSIIKVSGFHKGCFESNIADKSLSTLTTEFEEMISLYLKITLQRLTEIGCHTEEYITISTSLLKRVLKRKPTDQ